MKISDFIPDAAHAPLAHLDFICVDGRDAREFLQGQLSNDVNALDEFPVQFTSMNSPKGRVLAFGRLIKSGDRYWLGVDSEVAASILKRLGMFVLRSDVTLAMDEDFTAKTMIGKDIAQAMAGTQLPCPEPGMSVREGDFTIFSIPGPTKRFEIYGPRKAVESLKLDARELSPAELALQDILWRLPRLNEANQDSQVAQMLNLDELQAINFRKGCYTGQEVIARMHYLGKLKKRAVILAGETSGDDALVQDSDGKKVGEIFQSASHDSTQLHFAVVNLAAIESALQTSDGKALTLLAP